MATWEFPCSDPIDANISLASGSVTVTAAPTDVVAVAISRGRPGSPADDDQIASEVTVDFDDRHLVVSERPRRGFGWRNRDLYVTVGLPAGSRTAVHAASADVTCRGEYGAVEINTASGRIEAQTVHGPADISTMSGTVQIAEAGQVNAQSASGSFRVAHAVGDVTARSASGHISIGAPDASVNAKTASGRISIGRAARGRADLTSVSGDIDVKVAPGTGVFLDLSSLSGQVSSELAASDQEGEADLRLRCQTVSGSVQVSRAAS